MFASASLSELTLATIAFVIIVLAIALVVIKFDADGDRLPPAKKHARDLTAGFSGVGVFVAGCAAVLAGTFGMF